MSLEPLALMLYVASIMILWRVVESRGGEDGGDDPGSEGGGPGWRRRRRPPNPPPGGPVCWAEFERQFAEHVEALGAREGASSRSRDDRAERSVEPRGHGSP